MTFLLLNTSQPYIHETDISQLINLNLQTDPIQYIVGYFDDIGVPY